jgi:restriction system protein
MPVPDFQSIMLPMVRFIGDGGEHKLGEIIDGLANSFGLTETERGTLLPSGRQLQFDNRVGWAKLYLQKAGLVESTGRAKVKLTKRGAHVLQQNPPRIDIKFLMQYPEFVEFRRRDDKNGGTPEPDENPKIPTKTPLETLEDSYLHIRQLLAQELLDTVRKCRPAFFERLVVDLLLAMGYGGSRRDAGEAIGKSGDGGVDGIINEDRLGLDVVYIQAKRWANTVGMPEVQAFAGSLEGFRARKGVMITTSTFSPRAHEYVERIEKKIVLIDGEKLAQFMIDFGIGVSVIDQYTVKRMDQDYFELEG